MTRTNPYVFVVGCGRSGTTLLQRILDGHPRLAVANDSHFVLEPVTGYRPLHPVKGLEIGEDPSLTEDMVRELKNYRTFPRTGLPVESIDHAASRASTWFGLVSALYDELARHNGKEFAGEKSGRYVSIIPHLHAVFPRARFIHIIRDGRDVTLSALHWVAKRAYRGPGQFALYQHSPVATCALWWAQYVRNGQRDGRALGADVYHELRYEELTTDTVSTVRRLMDFLELPYTEKMLRFHEGRTRDDERLSSKKRWLPPTPGLRDWRTGMAAPDRELFEALSGDLLAELGYELGTTEASAAVGEAAAQYRRAWSEDLVQYANTAQQTRD